MSDDLTTRAEQLEAKRKGLIPEQQLNERYLRGLVRNAQGLDTAVNVAQLGLLLAEVARLREEQDRWIAHSQAEYAARKAAEASLAALRGLVEKARRGIDSVTTHMNDEAMWEINNGDKIKGGLLMRYREELSDLLAAIFPTNDTPKEPA